MLVMSFAFHSLLWTYQDYQDSHGAVRCPNLLEMGWVLRVGAENQDFRLWTSGLPPTPLQILLLPTKGCFSLLPHATRRVRVLATTTVVVGSFSDMLFSMVVFGGQKMCRTSFIHAFVYFLDLSVFL